MVADGLSALDDTLTSIATADSVSQTINIVERFIENMGFELFSYYSINEERGLPRNYLVTNYPKEWQREYTERRYMNLDPVVKCSRKQMLPFLWDDVLNHRETGPEQEAFFSAAKDAGIVSGASIPLYGPRKSATTMSVSSGLESRKFNQLWLERRHNLHVFSYYAHERLVQLLTKEKLLADYSLSPREKDCLLWTARGKSAWDIGQILNISQSTAEEYLASACRKLGVHGKIHAVVVAIMNGLITP
jgi:DNA-binding CsgD family transcriptional regulator